MCYIAFMEEFIPEQTDQTKKEKALHPELQEIVDEFDFSRLKDILAEHARGAGISEDDIYLVPPENIHGQTRSIGQYNPDIERPSIGLSYDDIQGRANEFRVDPKLLGMRTLIHEEIHAATDQARNREEQQDIKQVGYHRLGTHLMRLWNEGVTERLAREVLVTYGKSIGTISSVDLDNFIQTLNKRRESSKIYNNEVDLVDAFIIYLAQQTGVPEETVWRAIIADQFRGARLFTMDFVAETSDMFPPNFMDDFTNAQNDVTVRRLKKELRQPIEETNRKPRFRQTAFGRSLLRSFEDSLSAYLQMMP